jgi:hypothetical protein
MRTAIIAILLVACVGCARRQIIQTEVENIGLKKVTYFETIDNTVTPEEVHIWDVDNNKWRVLK